MDSTKLIDKLKEIHASWDFRTILILGGVGVGKTYAVKSVFKDAYFINEPTFKQQLSSGTLKLCPPEDWASRNAFTLENLVRKQLVVYDDYGTAEITEAYIDKFMYWLDERVNNPNKQTIITSNLTLEEIEKREKRISSRMLFNAKVITVTWPDMREKKTTFITV